METIKIIEIRDKSVLLQLENGETLLSARYTDDPAGDYVLDTQLEKQYIEDLDEVEQPDPEPEIEEDSKPSVPHNKKGRFHFEVTTYDAERWGPQGSYDKVIKADTLDEAEKKLERAYKAIYDAVCTKAYDKYGDRIRLPWENEH